MENLIISSSALIEASNPMVIDRTTNDQGQIVDIVHTPDGPILAEYYRPEYTAAHLAQLKVNPHPFEG